MPVMNAAVPFSISEASGSHADPVVPILLTLVLLTLAAVLGGRLMTLIKQPPVLGELIFGVLIGNLAYWFGNPGITGRVGLGTETKARRHRQYRSSSYSQPSANPG